MKVFEVRYETVKDDNKIEETCEYVMCETDVLGDVAKHFETFCEQYEHVLKSVRHVINIVRNIKPEENEE